MVNAFFEKINYSACNEDSESERLALKLTQQDTVLCITGSGARSLDLLIDQPKKLISIDFNPAQNNLLALKIAAYKTLDYKEFKSFIGIENNIERLSLYEKVSRKLSTEHKAYWKANYMLIKEGLLYSGRWENLLNKISKLTLVRKNMLQRLMDSESLESQAAFWNQHWDNAIWRFFLKVLSSRFLWTEIIREPGMSLVPADFNIYNYLHGRLNQLANNHLLRENHFANLLFYGRYQEHCILPIHLQEAHYDTIRNTAGSIEIISAPLIDVLKEKAVIQQVTTYSLSDFSSYASPEMYAAIWFEIASQSQAGARFCERQFLVKRSPETFHPNIYRNRRLEEKLNHADSTGIYTFCAGEIRT